MNEQNFSLEEKKIELEMKKIRNHNLSMTIQEYELELIRMKKEINDLNYKNGNQKIFDELYEIKDTLKKLINDR